MTERDKVAVRVVRLGPRGARLRLFQKPTASLAGSLAGHAGDGDAPCCPSAIHSHAIVTLKFGHAAVMSTYNFQMRLGDTPPCSNTHSSREF